MYGIHNFCHCERVGKEYEKNILCSLLSAFIEIA
jgi:hypothetical protein